MEKKIGNYYDIIGYILGFFRGYAIMGKSYGTRVAKDYRGVGLWLRA